MNYNSILFIVFVIHSFSLWSFSEECDVTVIVDSRESVVVNTSSSTFKCNSFASVVTILNGISNEQSVEILFSSGVHVLNQTVRLATTNITLRSASDDQPSIICSNELQFMLQQSAINTHEAVPVLEFTNAKFVEIYDIHFQGCPGSVSFKNISNLIITNSLFRLFSNGAVDVYNTVKTHIMNTTFEHNGPVENVRKTSYGRYVIHSGGLSIGTNFLDERTIGQDTPRIVIQHCIFVNNSAIPSDEIQLSATEVFAMASLDGRGGGLGIALNSPLHSYNVNISHCFFIGNKAKSIGGGLVTLTGRDCSHNITLYRDIFIENESDVAAGSVISSFGPGKQEAFNTFVVQDCRYYRNKAYQGGGAVYLVTGKKGVSLWNHVLFKNCVFESNEAFVYAAGLWCVSNDSPSTQVKFTIKPVDVINCSFIGNIAPDNVIVATQFTPMIFSGTNMFNKNQGSSVEIIGTTLDIIDTVKFLNSDSGTAESGAMHFLSFSQAVLHNQSTLLFINNTGRIGAAISVRYPQTITEVYSKILYNRLCFLVYQFPKTPPDEWNVNMAFIGNSASIGSVGHLNSATVNLCSWSQLKEPYFNKSNVLGWKFVNQRNNTDRFHSDEKQRKTYNIKTEPVKIVIQNKSVIVYPGERFPLMVVAYDEYNRYVEITVTLSDSQGFLHFNPSAALLFSDSQLLYTMVTHDLGMITANETYYIQIRRLNEPNTVMSETFSLRFKDCPPGYILGGSVYAECLCTNEYTKVVACNGTVATLNGQVWAISDTDSSSNIFTSHCPEGYCRCTETVTSRTCVNKCDFTNPDHQCTCNRKGLMCGECTNDSSLTVLFSNCVSNCHNYEWIIVILGLVECLLIAIFVRMLLHVNWNPSIYPLLFYIQFLPIATNSFSSGFSPFRVYPYYISSALSFYFPYDFCLSNRISITGLYYIRFFPLLVAIIIVPLTIGISWKWLKKSKKPWYSIWMLVLLLYSHIVSSAVSVLFCPNISSADGNVRKWYYAGNINCFTGDHIPLAIVAILVLILCFLLMPGSILLTKIDKHKIPHFMRRFQASLNTINHNYFFSYELLRRFLLIIFAIIFPGNKYPVFFVFLLLNIVIVYIRPYTSSTANNIELLLFITTTIMYQISLHGSFGCTFTVSSNVEECNLHNGFHSYIPLSTLIIAILYYMPIITGICLIIAIPIRKLLPMLSSKSLRKFAIKNHDNTVQPSTSMIMNYIDHSTNEGIKAADVTEVSIN